MYIDKDNWGKFSINDLSEKDLRMFYESLKAYARCNFGHLHPEDSVRMIGFDSEFNSVMANEEQCQKQALDRAGRRLCPAEPWKGID